MRPYLFFIFLSLWGYTACGQYQETTEKKAFYLYVARNYLSDVTPVLNSLEDTIFFSRFAKGETRQDLLDGFNTLVHEAVHLYNYEQGKFWHENYYIAEGINIKVRRQRVFNSMELNRIVPKAVQRGIFRYRTYIGDSSRVGSQINGFYGILEEFGAYYHGTKADLELKPFYQTFCRQSVCWVKHFLGNTVSTLHAYYEFRLFMAWYLRYAKVYHPGDYRKLTKDRNLRLAFTLLDQQYQDLVSDFFAVRQRLISRLQASGAEVRLQNDTILIWVSEKNILSYDTFDDEIVWLKSLMSQEDLLELEAFYLQGATLKNYQRFLD